MSDKVVEFKPKRRKTRKSSGLAVFIIILLIAVVGGAIYWFINSSGKAVTGLESQWVLSQMDYEGSSMADFYTYNENIYFCTKESMTFMDKLGKEIWRDSYSMLDPVMSCEGNAVAIADKQGLNLRVYNNNGILYNVEAECPISTFSVNENGYCVVVMKNTNSYILNLYAEDGTLKCTGNYPAEKGIPLAVDVSNDNKIYAISFLNTDEIKVSSNVVFCYVESKDIKTSEDGESMFASFVEENSVIAVMEFMEDNNFVAVSDRSIICAKVGTAKVNYEQKWRVDLNNQLKAVSFVGNKYISTVNGQSVINEIEKENEDIVKWYDLSGNVTGTYENGKKITGLYSSDAATVVACGKSFAGVNVSGKELWNYTSVQEITKALLFDNAGAVMMVSPSQMRIIQMQKGDNIDESFPVRNEDIAVEQTEITTEMPETTTEAATAPENDEE